MFNFLRTLHTVFYSVHIFLNFLKQRVVLRKNLPLSRQRLGCERTRTCFQIILGSWQSAALVRGTELFPMNGISKVTTLTESSSRVPVFYGQQSRARGTAQPRAQIPQLEESGLPTLPAEDRNVQRSPVPVQKVSWTF